MYRLYKNIDGLEIRLPDTIYTKIQQQISKHYPKECGGVFVGRIEGATAVIEKIMMPKKFTSSPVFFSRVVDVINVWLHGIFKKSKGNTIYLGEWHSHPNGQPTPSGTDYNAMKNIASYEHVRIKTPLLLIVGYDRRVYDECFYIFYNLKLISYDLM